MIKILAILALAAVGAWYLFNQAKQSQIVTETQTTAVEYTETLRKEAKKAQDTVKETAEKVGDALPKR